MKVIFIDVDGVLNTHEAFNTQDTIYAIDKKCMELFVNVVLETDANIVISSTWRLNPESRSVLMEHFKNLGIADRVLGNTPYLHRRSFEIKTWLKEHPHFNIEKFAIVDDLSEASDITLSNSFFMTNEVFGLTSEIAAKVIEHLK